MHPVSDLMLKMLHAKFNYQENLSPLSNVYCTGAQVRFC